MELFAQRTFALDEERLHLRVEGVHISQPRGDLLG